MANSDRSRSRQSYDAVSVIWCQSSKRASLEISAVCLGGYTHPLQVNYITTDARPV